jgi:hypothetical protein
MVLNAKTQLSEKRFKGQPDITGLFLLPGNQLSVQLMETTKKLSRSVQSARARLRASFKGMSFSLFSVPTRDQT